MYQGNKTGGRYKHLVLAWSIVYSRKVLTETGGRTTGLSFNVRLLYQLSYLDLYSSATQALYGVFNAMRGRHGSHMYVGSFMTPPERGT